MKNLFLFFHIFLLSISLFCQEEEKAYPFPDNSSAQINEEINTYQDYDYELTKMHTNRLLDYAEKCQEEELILLSYTALEYYSYFFNKREDFEDITIKADSVFKTIISTDNLSFYADYYFEHLNNYSVYLFRKNKIDEADTLISNAIDLLEQNTFEYNTKNYYLSSFYQNLSSFKELQWNFSEGKLLLNKADNLQDKSYFFKGYINQNLSSYHQKIGNYYEALDFAKLSLQNYKSDFENLSEEQYADYYFLSLLRLANLHLLVNDPESAQSYLEEISSRSLNKHPLEKARFYQTKAQINQSESKPIRALKNYKKCLKIQKEKLPNRTLDQAKVYQSIAEIYQQQNETDSTFYYLQQAIILLTNNHNLKDIETNPTQFQTVTYKQTLMDVLYRKSELALDKYSQCSDICNLLLAKQSTESAQNLADKIRLDLSSNPDKELFSKKGHKIYAQAMKIASLLENIEHSDAHLNFAYRAMESSRALLLAEAVYQSNTQEFAGIPNDFIKREEAFQEKIVEKERQIFHLEQEGKESTNYQKEKWQLQVNFDKFTDSLKILYPNYYELKFAVQRPDIKVLQADLKADNQTFVEYFVGEENIYALIIAGDRFELKDWPRSPRLQEQIRALRTAIYKPKNYKESALIFANYADTLYRELVLPLGDLPERLVIVPDGVLSYLPFDVLLTESPEVVGNYSDYKFLLKQKQISYDYSANLRMQKRKKQKTELDFIGFAPAYNADEPTASRGIGDLKYNINEVNYISTLYNGIAYVKEAANVQIFKEEASKAWILHFAGHAVQEEINPDFSHLLFSESIENPKDNQLPVRDIYARPIAAEMVVLSACNTGMGEIQEGEGMYSLGRAFSYAGANSLISTLWSVNDESTEQIMINFYINLKQGMSKDRALQQAKITYIEDRLRHKDAQPRNWAGFIAYGDMRELNFESWVSRLFN